MDRKKATFRPSAAKKGPKRADFIIPTCDDRGHSAKVQFRCNPGYPRRTQIIVQSGKFPFKTISDLLRWCFDHGLRELERLEPDLSLDMASLEVVNTIIRRTHERIQFMDSLKNLTREVNDLLEREVTQEAQKILKEVQVSVDRIEDGYWRDWYSQELVKRFGHLLTPGQPDGNK